MSINISGTELPRQISLWPKKAYRNGHNKFEVNHVGNYDVVRRLRERKKERKNEKCQLSQTHLNIQRFLSAASDKDSFM